MNMTKTYVFFDSKSKKTKKQGQQIVGNHSRSLSAKSDLTKNSARNKTITQKPQGLPLTKKQKQIREAIQYRYKKSKMREFVLQFKGSKARENISRSNSSQMEEYRQLKMLKVVNLKQHHDKIVKQKLQEKQKNSLRSKLRIRTDSSLIIKTEGSQKSMQKIKFLKPYIQSQLTPTKLNSKLKSNPSGKIGNNLLSKSKQDWRFISIQCKERDKAAKDKQKQSKSRNKDTKINSHRTLTVQTNERSHHLKTVESQWEFAPKVKDLGKLNKKYRF